MPFHYDSPGLENIDQVNDLLKRSPTYQKALRGEWRSPDLPDYVDVNGSYKAVNLRLAAQADGYNIPGGYIDPKSGKVSDPNRERWYNSPAFWGPVAVGASGAAGGFAAGGSGSTGGATGGGYVASDVSSTAAATGNTAVDLTAAGGSAAGGSAAGGSTASGSATGSNVAPAVTKAAGFSWKDWLPIIVGSGTSLVGAKISANGQKDAAKIQADSADKALAYQKEMFERQQADLAPYREVGQSSMRQLAYGTGLPIPDMPPKQPAPVAASSSSSQTVLGPNERAALERLGAGSGAVAADARQGLVQYGAQPQQMVSVRSPSGQVGQIPASQLQAALAAGGKQVQ